MSLKTERLLARAKKLIKKGELKAARDIYSNILKSFPNNLEAKKRLIYLDQNKALNPPQDQIDQIMKLYSSDQVQEAQITIKKLISDFPNSALLYNIQGACYSRLEMTELAIASFKEAINLKSDYAEVHYNLGVAFQNLSLLDDSEKSYNLAIKYNHPYPTAHNNLGVLFLKKGQIDDAVKSFEWAIAYNNNYAEAYNNLGSALQEKKLYREAKKQFEKAISINSQYSQAFHNLGIICEILNLKKEAIAHYKKTISIDPEFAEAHRNLSKIKRFKINDKHISQMKILYEKKSINLQDKARLGFALSKVYDDLGNQEEQFNYLNKANKFRKKVLNYSIEDSKNFHSIITNLFASPQPVVNISKNPEIKPIFIVGMPRSGTSLVEQIMSSHHAVHGAGELLYFRNILTPILDSHLSSNRKSFREKDMLLLRNNYLDSIANLNTDRKIITDKMPMNFRLLGFILSAIPEAKIIHIKRDPVATCWSNFNHYFTAGNGFSFDQKDLAEFYNLYLELMKYWHKLFPDKIYDLSYEDLTINQKTETKQLIEYCGLVWDDNCLNFHKNERPVLTASSAQVRKKMYQGSSEEWKKYSNYLQPLINGLIKDNDLN